MRTCSTAIFEGNVSVFYQQSGKRGEADFRKTISTPEGGLRFFTAAQLKDDFGYDLASEALESLSQEQVFRSGECRRARAKSSQR
jgi:hypothetical protein